MNSDNKQNVWTPNVIELHKVINTNTNVQIIPQNDLYLEPITVEVFNDVNVQLKYVRKKTATIYKINCGYVSHNIYVYLNGGDIHLILPGIWVQQFKHPIKLDDLFPNNIICAWYPNIERSRSIVFINAQYDLTGAGVEGLGRLYNCSMCQIWTRMIEPTTRMCLKCSNIRNKLLFNGNVYTRCKPTIKYKYCDEDDYCAHRLAELIRNRKYWVVDAAVHDNI